MDLQTFFEAPLIIRVHAISALGALLIGLVQIFGPKGVLPHRVLGYSFVALMAMVVSSAFFIRSDPEGAFSWIHIFIPVTLIGLFGLVRGAMRRDRSRHLHNARSLFFGALIIPGLFAFLPGRLMHAVVFGG